MDIAIGAILGSDTLIGNGEDLRLAALRYAAALRPAGVARPAILEIAASEVLGRKMVTDFTGRLRGWLRARLNARQLSSLRVLILNPGAPVSLPAESAKANWHYVVALCPCVIRVGENCVSAGDPELVVYNASEAAQLQAENVDGFAPGIVMDGLAW